MNCLLVCGSGLSESCIFDFDAGNEIAVAARYLSGTLDNFEMPASVRPKIHGSPCTLHTDHRKSQACL
jgi:hypothetical protein